MKKWILIVMAILLCLVFTGCSEKEEVYKKIDVGISQGDNCVSAYTYSDEDTLLLALGRRRDDVWTGPGTGTYAIAKINIAKQTLSKLFSVNGSAQIDSAVPYGEGILYVTYQNLKGGDLHWEIVHAENDTEKTLTEGKCGGWFDLPMLDTLSGEVVLLWKDMDKKTCGLSTINKDGITKIFEKKIKWLISLDKSCNGKEMCVYALEKGKPCLAVIDLEGDIKYYRVDGKMMSFAVSKDNAVCVLSDSDDMEVYHINSYNLRSEDVKTKSLSKPLYRLSGSETGKILGVDERFKIICLNAKTNEIEERESPDGLSFNPVRFGRVNIKNAVASFSKDNSEEYYVINGL